MPSTRVREETLPTETTTAYLAGDELVLEEFRERDPDVVASRASPTMWSRRRIVVWQWAHAS